MLFGLTVELWSLAQVLVADQLNFFIVFYKTYRPPEWRPCPFVSAYMAPGPSNKFLLIGSRFSLIWSVHGMGPFSPTLCSPYPSGVGGLRLVGRLPPAIKALTGGWWWWWWASTDDESQLDNACWCQRARAAGELRSVSTCEKRPRSGGKKGGEKINNKRRLYLTEVPAECTGWGARKDGCLNSPTLIKWI